MTIAIYIRVSTDEQAQHGFSIDHQKERLEQYCLSQGWNEYRFYIDDGYTGTNIDRPALKRLIKHVENKKISLVLVYRLDRLGRRQKDVLHLLEDVFDKMNVPFKSATEPFDTSTPLGKAMLGILAVFAQLERDTIVERVTAGRRMRLKKGLWHGGRVPFGYQWNKSKQTLEIIPEEAELVRQIFDRFLKGDSSLAISDWISKRSKLRVFNHSVIAKMLRRPTYIGMMHSNDGFVEGNHESIIDIETFNRAQEELKRRMEGRRPKGDYMLSGLLRCGVCGGSVIHIYTKRHGKIYEYYACKAQHVRRKDASNDCSLGYNNMAKLEKWVIDSIKRISLNIEEVIREIKAQNSSEDDTKTLVKELQVKLDKIDEKLNRWYDAFEQGILNPGQLKARITKLEDEKKALEAYLEDIDDRSKPNNQEATIEALKTIGETWELLTVDEQKTVLREAVEIIILYPDKKHKIIWNA